MPTWVRPNDVVFDHAAATAALEAIAAMRFTLDWAWSVEDRSAQAAMGSWDGLAADAFRRSHGARRAVSGELAVRLQMLAAQIEDAVDRASAEQARVDALQAEWDAQARAGVGSGGPSGEVGSGPR